MALVEAPFATRAAVNTPNRQVALPENTAPVSDATPDADVQVSGQGPISAIVGLQSPYHDQRSIVALLAASPQGFEMLNNALQDSKQKALVYGSVAIFRDSGVNSLKVGDVYYVGHLPWWERVWNQLATHPVLLAFMAVVAVVLIAILLWNGLRALSRRRLSSDDQD